ncbi:MAG: PAS domain S-box protein [Deltaproteobacteria bacterium]|nr:PAS domain S-box protein [Deltaproteobacteria bacterium]
MEETQTLNVAIVGGGPGCKAIMDMIFAKKLRQLQMNLIGVASTNPRAVGYLYAREKGVYTAEDYRDLYELKNLDMIIELTGRDEVANEILRTKPDRIQLMSHVPARLFWDIFQIEEDRIEELKQAKDALRESEEKYGPLVENSLTGIFIHQDGKYVFVNDRFAEIHGYKREDLRGEEPFTLVHPDEREALRQLSSQRLKGEAVPQRYEVRRLRKDGKTIWCEMLATRIEYAGKSAIMGNIVDITERKRAEEALRESERKFRSVAQSANDAVILSDRHGNIVFWNMAAQKMFGFSQEEIMDQPLTILMPERYKASHKNGIESHSSKGESQVLGKAIELAGIRKDGSQFPLELSLATWEAGEDLFYTGIIRDISERQAAKEALMKAHDELEHRVQKRTAELAKTTEQLQAELAQRRRTEEALQRARKNIAQKAAALEEVNEALSQYIHIASHDLKSLLRGIHLYADFLEEDPKMTLDENQKGYAHALSQAVRQSEHLADDLLELSQVDRRNMSVSTVELAAFFKELITSIDPSSEVEVVMRDDWPTIDTDPTLLRQIFENLIRNAIHFNNSQQKRVELGWVPLGEEHYEVSVRDNGIGIDPNYHEQVFGAFERLWTRREYEGTGLGLAIVKKALAKLHGSARIESKAGKGSTFFIALPSRKRRK